MSASRARAWQHAAVEAFCDVIEPWEYGTVARATRYPTYWDYNVVRCERHPSMGAEELAAFADEALAGLAHRRVDFEDADAAEPLRADFARLGWRTTRLVWMRHARPRPPGLDVRVEGVPFDAANGLRTLWHYEDFPDTELGDHLVEEREASRARDAQTFVVRDAAELVGFSQIEWTGGSAEIASVYVHPEHRGRGLGTAITCAAIDAAGDADDLWIVADDEDRPKELYRRLGFDPVWTLLEALRVPSSGRSPIQ